MSQRFNGRRLSVLRVVALCAALGAVVAGAIFGWARFEDARAASAASPIFSAYVDVTATPTLKFEDIGLTDQKDVVLSFIVSDHDSACKPTWGGFYDLDQAGVNMDLDRRIARFTKNGGEVTVSFGGASNSELATLCTDPVQLQRAYQRVIDRYEIRAIDLDVEGESLTDAAGGTRRAEAIAAVQKAQTAAGKPLSVWLTLPVTPTGLTEDGTRAVAQMLAADVDLAGVNVMNMDYGTGITSSAGMLSASISAAKATHQQLGVLYTAAQNTLGDKTLWSKIGLTPMIGQNDVPSEVFGIDAAQGLNTFARDMEIGRMSMWSLNRDATCGPNYPDVKRVSDACSGVDQGGLRFADVLANGIGNAPRMSDPTATAEPSLAPVIDDPATSPYQIWTPDASYVAEDRVVWHGNVYSAKFWTLGDLPDDPSATATVSPWELIGPVLPGDKPQPVIEVPEGTYPAWMTEVVYEKGERVLFEGRIFEVKWWSQGESPQAALEGSNSSPWLKLKNDEVARILADQ